MYNKNEDSIIKKWLKKIRAINQLGKKCTNCNDTDIKHLSFHHLDPNKKETGINEILGNSWKKIEEEIKKCILLCHNCHAEHHFIGDNCRTITKKTFLEYKGGICKKCGYSKCPAALTFHHLDKSTKLFRLSRARHVFRNICDITEKFVEELDKCDLLCANCHSEEHIRHDLIEYAVKNYNTIKIKDISRKFDREIISDLYFNQNKPQKEICDLLNIKKSTLSGIIKELKKHT
jgi:hypothetical protein